MMWDLLVLFILGRKYNRKIKYKKKNELMEEIIIRYFILEGCEYY